MISVTRGDSLIVSVSLSNSDGTSYEMQDGDKLMFTVKKNTSVSSDAIISIENECEDGTVFELTPDDTELSYGTYYYDVELTTAGGRRYTVVKPDKFKVTEEVSTHD